MVFTYIHTEKPGYSHLCIRSILVPDYCILFVQCLFIFTAQAGAILKSENSGSTIMHSLNITIKDKDKDKLVVPEVKRSCCHCPVCFADTSFC